MLNNIVGLLNDGVGGFSPASITGLKLWLDAADSATITLNGSNVSQWNDKSTNAFNFDQGTAGNQPARTLSGQNGKTVLTFSSNDFLKNTSINWGASASTLFIVGKEDNTAGTGYQNFFTTGTGATGQWGYGIAANSPTDNNRIAIFDIGEGLDRFTNQMTNSNADIMCFTSNGISAGSVTANLFFNASADASNPVTRNSTTSAAGAQLGAAASGSEAYNGTICEVIMYDTVLSSGNRILVQDYLKAKWATI